VNRVLVRAVAVAVVLAFYPLAALAHIGSPDVFLDGQAGPYRLLVTVRPPRVVPGVADVEILTADPDIGQVHIVPLLLTRAVAQFAPVSDLAVRSPDDPRLFTGHLWMMMIAEWQVQVTVDGQQGSGTLSVPVPALPQSTLGMHPIVRAVLLVFMVLLSLGFIAIVSTMFREARLEPGIEPGPEARRRGRIAGAAATCLVVVVLVLGNSWWSAEASTYESYIYKPLRMEPSIAPGARLRLALKDPGWIFTRRVDDFIADHDHLMHLFIVSPALDRFWHLHPNEMTTGTFEQQLPTVPQGRYDLFADVVHKTGVPETIAASLDIPAPEGAALETMHGDDSGWSADRPPAHIVWVRGTEPLVAKRLTLLTFRVEDAAGQPATDLELYMGMPGHAIILRDDRRVFAHVHPFGSAPMATLQIAMPSGDDPHAQHHLAGSPAVAMPRRGGPSTVTFPYGFPESGNYRIFVQVKRGGVIETGAFDAHVD
jgi:hypothetical protein